MTTRRLKIIEITNVDFSLRHFLLPLMRALRARGHEVIGSCADGSLLDEVRAEGFRVIPVGLARTMSPLAHWRAFRELVALFRAEKPDLVHAHMPISGFLARIAAWWAGVPRIAYTCHGFWFNEGGSPLRVAASFAMEWLAGRITDVYLTVSQAEAADARRLGFAHAPVAVGNGRDPAMFHPDPAGRAAIRAELDTAPDQVVAVAVSRLIRLKGYPELAAAAREIPELHVWVVGERLPTDRGEDMAALLDNAGLGRRLKRLGYRHDVAAILAAADIFVLPSLFEGLPMSVIEAMLTGLPVVASDIKGPNEQVVHGVTGLLVPPRDPVRLRDSLQQLTRDAGLRARMGEAGRARAVELYDEAKVLRRTVALLGL